MAITLAKTYAAFKAAGAMPPRRSQSWVYY
jgi:hypothetical protein